MNSKLMTSVLMAICALGVVACSKSMNDGIATVPGNMTNASPDAAVDDQSSVVVVITNRGESNVRGQQLDGERLTEFIRGQLSNKTGAARIVYLKGDSRASFASLVEALKSVRSANVDRVALVVKSARSADAAHRFEIRLLAAATTPAKEAVSEEKVETNPYLLRVSIAADRRVMLNQTDYGTVDDPTALVSVIRYVITTRAELGITIADAKMVMIYAARSVSYADVATVIDAIVGTGATPIGIALDEEAPRPTPAMPTPEMKGIEGGVPGGIPGPTRQ